MIHQSRSEFATSLASMVLFGFVAFPMAARASGNMTQPMMMSAPMMPTIMACQAPNMLIHPSDPRSSRPLGVSVANGMLTMSLGFSQLGGPVDVYLMVQMPDGQRMFLDGFGQWMPYPPNIVAWRMNSAQAMDAEVFQMPMSPGLMAGMYNAYVIMTPAGMDPLTFNLDQSPYYLWCFNQSLP